MTETVDAIPAWRSETLPAVANGADILRSFERLRVGIALDTSGVAGSFAGYEWLDLKARALVDPGSGTGGTGKSAGEIVLAAFVVRGRGRTQRVHYAAYARETGPRASTPATRLVAEAVGLTVALPVAPIRPTAPTPPNDPSTCDV